MTGVGPQIPKESINFSVQENQPQQVDKNEDITFGSIKVDRDSLKAKGITKVSVEAKININGKDKTFIVSLETSEDNFKDRLGLDSSNFDRNIHKIVNSIGKDDILNLAKNKLVVRSDFEGNNFRFGKFNKSSERDGADGLEKHKFEAIDNKGHRSGRITGKKLKKDHSSPESKYQLAERVNNAFQTALGEIQRSKQSQKTESLDPPRNELQPSSEDLARQEIDRPGPPPPPPEAAQPSKPIDASESDTKPVAIGPPPPPPFIKPKITEDDNTVPQAPPPPPKEAIAAAASPKEPAIAKNTKEQLLARLKNQKKNLEEELADRKNLIAGGKGQIVSSNPQIEDLEKKKAKIESEIRKTDNKAEQEETTRSQSQVPPAAPPGAKVETPTQENAHKPPPLEETLISSKKPEAALKGPPPPPPDSARQALLDSIRKGKKLKTVSDRSSEMRKKEPTEKVTNMPLPEILEKALNQRRGIINPVDQSDDDDSDSEWHDDD